MEILSLSRWTKDFNSQYPASFKTREASSNGVSYVNPQLDKYKDDESPFTHWNEINAQPRDGLSFQSRILHKQRGIEVEYSQQSIFQRENGAIAINQEKKRYPSASDAIKTVSLYQPTTDPTVVLKTGYRQTDTQTKYIFTVWQTLSFHSREQSTSLFPYKSIPKSSDRVWKSV